MVGHKIGRVADEEGEGGDGKHCHRVESMTDWTDDGQEDERWGVAKIKNLPGINTKLSKGTGIRVKMVNILFLYCQGFC